MPDNRSKLYPDISFTDTNAERLINSMVQSYETIAKRRLYPADPVRLFILWMADIIIQERVIIDTAAKQNVPRFAEGDNLDSLAELFYDKYRAEAQPARVTLRFTLSMAPPSAITIDAGAKVSVDGEITFATVKDLEIPPGELFGDVAAVCLTDGSVGNGFTPGQISQIVDPFMTFEKVENITNSAGGANKETDEAFYERLRNSLDAYSTAGPAGAYIYLAKTALSTIQDVVAHSPGAGCVDVRILMENGGLPDEAAIQKVYEALSADNVRPLTDNVTVSGPGQKYFDIEFVYYIPEQSVNSITKIDADVKNATDEYKRWQAGKMGRDINPSRLISLLMETGIKRVVLSKPVFEEVGKLDIAVPASCSAVCGGAESG